MDNTDTPLETDQERTVRERLQCQADLLVTEYENAKTAEARTEVSHSARVLLLVSKAVHAAYAPLKTAVWKASVKPKKAEYDMHDDEYGQSGAAAPVVDWQHEFERKLNRYIECQKPKTMDGPPRPRDVPPASAKLDVLASRSAGPSIRSLA